MHLSRCANAVRPPSIWHAVKRPNNADRTEQQTGQAPAHAPIASARRDAALRASPRLGDAVEYADTAGGGEAAASPPSARARPRRSKIRAWANPAAYGGAALREEARAGIQQALAMVASSAIQRRAERGARMMQRTTPAGCARRARPAGHRPGTHHRRYRRPSKLLFAKHRGKWAVPIPAPSMPASVWLRQRLDIHPRPRARRHRSAVIIRRDMMERMQAARILITLSR